MGLNWVKILYRVGVWVELYIVIVQS